MAAVSASVRRIEQHRRREHGDRRFEFREPSRRIGQRTESHFAAVAQVGDGFGDQRERGVERGAILRKRKSVHRAAPGRAGRLAAQQFAQPVKFENVFRGTRHVFLGFLSVRRATCEPRGQKLRGLRGSGRLVHEWIA